MKKTWHIGFGTPILLCIIWNVNIHAATSQPDTDPSSAQAHSSDVEEQAWSLINTLIQTDTVPGATYSSAWLESGQWRSPELHYAAERWRENTDRLLRELALRFYDAYPGDPRRWRGLWATLHRDPRYYTYVALSDAGLGGKLSDKSTQPLIDLASYNAWEKRRLALENAFVNSKDTPPGQRGELKSEMLSDELGPVEYSGARKHFDWMHAAMEACEIAKEFPAAEAIEGNVALICRMAQRWSPDHGITVEKMFQSSPNLFVRAIGFKAETIEKAKTVPIEIEFTAVDGQRVDLAQLRGKVVLIDFTGLWWCEGCRHDEPELKATYKKYHDKGFEIIGITYEMKEADRQRVQSYIKDNGLGWPHYFDGKGRMNPYLVRFGITAVPEYFLLDQRGLLVKFVDGEGTNFEELVGKYLKLDSANAPKSAAQPSI